MRHATPPEYALFDALTCMRLGLSVGQNHPQRPRNARAFLCDEKRLLRLGLPAQSLASSDAIARECRVDLTPGYVTPPRALLPEGTDARAFLKRLCTDGLKARGMATSKSAKAQLRCEVEVVCALELEEFFWSCVKSWPLPAVVASDAAGAAARPTRSSRICSASPKWIRYAITFCSSGFCTKAGAGCPTSTWTSRRTGETKSSRG